MASLGGPLGPALGLHTRRGGQGVKKPRKKLQDQFSAAFFHKEDSWCTTHQKAAEKSPRCTTHKKSRGKITAVHHAQKKPRKNHRGAPRTKKATEKSPRCTTHKKSRGKITAVHHAQKKPQKNHRGAPHTKKATEKSPRCTTQKCCNFFFKYFFTAVNHVKFEEVAKR